MEYWLIVIDEIADQTGVEFSTEQRETAAKLIESAASVHDDYSAPIDRSEPVVTRQNAPERAPAWWEDVRALSGKDWVLAKQIHHLISSRHG